jgi:hypothetical protein
LNKEIEEETEKAKVYLEEAKMDYYYNYELGSHLEKACWNVEHLLSKLEIATKALKKLSVEMPGSRENELVLHRERLAKAALEQLKE